MCKRKWKEKDWEEEGELLHQPDKVSTNRVGGSGTKISQLCHQNSLTFLFLLCSLTECRLLQRVWQCRGQFFAVWAGLEGPTREAVGWPSSHSCQWVLWHRKSASASLCLYILISQTWLGRPPPLQIIILIISIFGKERRARTPGESSEDKGRVCTEEASLVQILRGRALGGGEGFLDSLTSP